MAAAERRSVSMGDRPDRHGTYRWMLCRGLAVRENGRTVRIAGSLTDITEGKVADALTGLPNRLLFVDRVQRSVEQARRYNTGGPGDRTLAVLFLDVDDFKLINDSYGHDAGDQFLIEMARRLEQAVRACDSVVSRLGGDEFAILLENLGGPDDATAVADRIAAAMAPPFQVDGRELFVRGSVGVAVHHDACETAEQLIREADVAMYHAKQSAHLTHQLFEPAMIQQASARLEMGSELREAVARGEILTHYQPIVELASGRTAGFEALLRWRSPRFGMVPPSRFIPLAEDNGAILPLGRHVLRTAVDAAARFDRGLDRPLLMSVNLSPHQLVADDLPGLVGEALQASGLRPEALKLEVTESAVMQNPERSVELLEQLDALGVAIGLDDFGTGYSSLSYLHQMPLSVLKIDRSFVAAMCEGGRENAIVETIVRLADSLHLDVIAEGVETADQAARLRDLGCRYAQGFLYSPAVPEAAAEALLDRQWPLDPQSPLDPQASSERQPSPGRIDPVIATGGGNFAPAAASL